MQFDISQGKTARNIMFGHRRGSKVRDTRRMAATAVITLGAVYKFAIKAEHLQTNLARGVERFKTALKELHLSEREIAALAEALAEFEREDQR